MKTHGRAISQNKADALLALESQVAQASDRCDKPCRIGRAICDMQAQLLKESQDMAYDQQWRMDERAYNQQMQQEERDYNQQLAMAKANAPKAQKVEKPNVPTRADVETAYILYNNGNGTITKSEYDAILAAYLGGFGINNTAPQKVTPNISQSGYEAAPNNPTLQAAINQSTQTGDITPLVQYYISLGLYSDDEIAEIVNRMLGQ